MRHILVGLLILFASGCAEAPAERSAPKPAVSGFDRLSSGPAHGERLARILGCIDCHGEDLAGEDWSEPGWGRLWTANVSRVAHRFDDDRLIRAIGTGYGVEGRELWEMPSYLFTHLVAADMADLLSFLRSRPQAGEAHPPPQFEKGARDEIAAGALKSAPAQVREAEGQVLPVAPGSHERARYIVRSTCAECHGLDLKGGQPFAEAALRPDLRIVSAYEKEQFRRLLRTGIAVGDRELGLMGEVARGRYRHFSDDEIDSIYLYLSALGPPD